MQIILAALLFFAGSVAATPLSAAPRNILLILADDYGIDVTRYYPTSDRRATTPPAPATPNLAALARAGVIFRNAWAEPSCSPTRATIFTGRYAFRTGIGKPVPADLSSPPPVLSVGAFSLPEAFAGFRTLVQTARNANVAVHFVDVRSPEGQLGQAGLPGGAADTGRAVEDRDATTALALASRDADGARGVAQSHTRPGRDHCDSDDSPARDCAAPESSRCRTPDRRRTAQRTARRVATRA